MKRSSWISVLAASGLLVAGCSSGSGTAAPAATAASASSSPSSSSSSASSSSSSASSSSSSDPSSSGTSSEDGSSTKASAAELDEETTTWFKTFCTSITDIGQYTEPDTTGKSLTDAQSTVVSAYTGLSASAAKAAVLLQATPAPTITSGDEVSAGFVTAFQNLADV